MSACSTDLTVNTRLILGGVVSWGCGCQRIFPASIAHQFPPIPLLLRLCSKCSLLRLWDGHTPQAVVNYVCPRQTFKPASPSFSPGSKTYPLAFITLNPLKPPSIPTPLHLCAPRSTPHPTQTTRCLTAASFFFPPSPLALSPSSSATPLLSQPDLALLFFPSPSLSQPLSPLIPSLLPPQLQGSGGSVGGGDTAPRGHYGKAHYEKMNPQYPRAGTTPAPAVGGALD